MSVPFIPSYLFFTKWELSYILSSWDDQHIANVFKLAHAEIWIKTNSSTSSVTDCSFIHFTTDTQLPPSSHLLRHDGRRIALFSPLGPLWVHSVILFPCSILVSLSYSFHLVHCGFIGLFFSLGPLRVHWVILSPCPLWFHWVILSSWFTVG